MNDREPHDKAEVSRILHFVIETPSLGIRCRPAIVVEDYPELRQPGLVDISVFTDGAADGPYGIDNHRHGSDDNMPEAGNTTRVNYSLASRLEVAIRPNHSCRAVGSWHWPRECRVLQDPINPYIDTTGVKVHHVHGLGLAGDFCPACRREYEETHAPGTRRTT